jgi:GNAT superfamily N-acetyltransferase
MPAFTLRELEPRDNDAARDMVLAILNGEYGMALTLEELPDLVDIHRTYRREGEGNYWVASRDGRIVGSIGLLRLSGDDFELRRMYVEGAQRGQGIAQALLDLSLQWARDHGVGALWLETNEQWKAAHHIYEKHGFQPVAQTELPPGFPVVRVATGFYRLGLGDRRRECA